MFTSSTIGSTQVVESQMVALRSVSLIYMLCLQELSLLHGDHLGYFNEISLPENATYELGGMGNQVSNVSLSLHVELLSHISSTW